MSKDSGKDLSELAVDGGMSNSDLCMQVRFDISLLPPHHFSHHHPLLITIVTIILTHHPIQTQADLIGIPVQRPQMRETTALGAAIAAGLAVKVWSGIDELRKVNTAGRTTFKPEMEAEKSKSMFARWEKAVQMSRGWAS